MSRSKIKYYDLRKKWRKVKRRGARLTENDDRWLKFLPPIISKSVH